MQVSIIPCLSDNYAYLLCAPGSSDALIVDPSEPGPVENELAKQSLRLAGILCTHHHGDHVGGNQDLLARHPGIPVYGYTSDRGRIPGQTHFLEHGERFSIAGLEFQALHVPGHTLGAVTYFGQGAAFTGDTLFAAGCGRLFEGTPAMMYDSLNHKLGNLPDSTKVYCGHEYTQSNLKFAAFLEPGNPHVKAKQAQAADRRARGEPTVPSTIAEEKLTNPFMRVDSPEIILRVAVRLKDDRSPSAVLGAVRAEKDGFKA